jgi:hypothetical protein
MGSMADDSHDRSTQTVVRTIVTSSEVIRRTQLTEIEQSAPSYFQRAPEFSPDRTDTPGYKADSNKKSLSADHGRRSVGPHRVHTSLGRMPRNF